VIPLAYVTAGDYLSGFIIHTLRMKSRIVLATVLSASCIMSACTKTEDNLPPPAAVVKLETDYSTYLLSTVIYPASPDMPYTRDAITLQYDSLKRITQSLASGVYTSYSYEADKITETMYVNSVSLTNMTSQTVYYYDNNKNISHHTTAWYNKPASVADYTRLDITEYEYNAEGYLVALKSAMFGSILFAESRFTWTNGNLTHQENIHYNISTNPSTVLGTDVIDFSYDERPLYPESQFLYEGADLRISKANRNNVTGIILQKYDPLDGRSNSFKTIEYTYLESGKRLSNVAMKATTTQDKSIMGDISFGYTSR
jgi:hypothetical protein